MNTPADRYVDRLLAGRRPRPFTPTDDDLARIRAAVTLTGTRREDAAPSAAFTARLRDELAAQLTGHAALEPAREPAPETGGEPALGPTPQATGEAAPEPGAGPGRRPRRQPRRRLLMTLRYGRRRFLGAGLLTAGAFSAGLLTDSLLKAASPGAPAAPQDAELLPAHGAWHTVTTSQALPEGSVIDFDLGAVTGFVHRTQGRLRAVSGVCTHQACRLTLDIPRTGLVCPCHGATFTLAGRNLHNYRSHHPLPALPRLPVRELDGAIQVYAPDIPPPPEPA